jgi:hypothetical protein
MGMMVVLKDGTVLRNGSVIRRVGRKKTRGGFAKFAWGTFAVICGFLKVLGKLGILMMILAVFAFVLSGFLWGGPIGVIVHAFMVMMLNWMLKEIS